MEDFKELEISVWSLQTGEWLTFPKELKIRPSAKSVQAALANHLMLLMAETPIVVSDKEPTGGSSRILLKNNKK